jgi:hypothetical protein
MNKLVKDLKRVEFLDLPLITLLELFTTSTLRDKKVRRVERGEGTLNVHLESIESWFHS